MSLRSFCGRRALSFWGVWLDNIFVSKLSPDAPCSLSSNSCSMEQYFSTSEFRLLTEPLFGIVFTECSEWCLLAHVLLWFPSSQSTSKSSSHNSTATASWEFSPSEDSSGWLSPSSLRSAVSELRLSLSVVSWYSSELWQWGHFPGFLSGFGLALLRRREPDVGLEQDLDWEPTNQRITFKCA